MSQHTIELIVDWGFGILGTLIVLVLLFYIAAMICYFLFGSKS